jgi:RND family efflux transporter MFP subunit
MNDHMLTQLTRTLATLALGGLLAISHARAEEDTPAAAPALTVTVAKPHVLEWPETIVASGAIEAWQEASVSAQIGGQRIAEILAEVGDVVTRGQVLARLDTELLGAELAELQAALAQAEASREEARANRERAENLRGRDLLSEQDTLRAVTQAAVAETQVAAARARLASQRLRLQYAEIVAPDDGVVTARSAMLGAVTQTGQELFRMIRAQRLEWRGELTAEQIARLTEHASVDLALPDGSKAHAALRTVAPAMTAGSRLALVYADIAPGSAARAGMYAEGTIQLAPKPALAVPAGSVVIRDGRSIVFTLAADARGDIASVAARNVEIGRRRETQVEILNGLEAGERVVLQGAGFLSDGDVVRIAPGAARGGAE